MDLLQSIPFQLFKDNKLDLTMCVQNVKSYPQLNQVLDDYFTKRPEEINIVANELIGANLLNLTLSLAITNQNFDYKETILILLKHGIDVNNPRFRPLRCSVFCIDRMKILLDHGADINGMDSTTALSHACWKGLLDSSIFLMERGADPNIHTKPNYLPLVYLCSFLDYTYFPEENLDEGKKLALMILDKMHVKIPKDKAILVNKILGDFLEIDFNKYEHVFCDEGFGLISN